MAKVATLSIEPKALILEYFLPGAILSSLCSFIGMQLFGISILGQIFKPEAIPALYSAIIQVVFSLTTVMLYGVILSKISQCFSGKADLISSLKLLVFAALPVLLASIFSLYPALSVISLVVVLRALYIYFQGLAVVLEINNRFQVFFASLISFIFISILLSFVFGAIAPKSFSEEEIDKIIAESSGKIFGQDNSEALRIQ